MIRIVDYGLGNVQAFTTLFKRLDLRAERARKPEDLQDASHLILPGVGAFDHAMESLNRSGMRDTLEHAVLRRKVPVLGVCVGMQMLASSSDEGQLAGLGWVPGRVRAMAAHPAARELPMPHMGWNDVVPRRIDGLFANSGAAPRFCFYFLHSYYFDCDEPACVAATAGYGFDFTCAVSSGNVYGVQCHPEKSHRWGAMLLRNFARL